MSSITMAQPRQPQAATPKKQTGHSARRLEPMVPAVNQPKLLSWQGVRRTADGHLVPTTDVIPYTGGPVNSAIDDPTQNAFDIFQSDALGVPTGGDACVASGLTQPGSRWFFGATYICCSTYNDFQVAPAAVNKPLDRLDLAWNWGTGAVRAMSILVETYDNYTNCSTGLPGFSGAVGGIVLNFTAVAGGGGYYYYNAGLPPLAAAALPAPADGSGTYHLAMGSYDATTQVFTFDNVAGTQPMLWANVAATQLGTSDSTEWNDDGGAGTNTTNGTLAIDECNDFAGVVPCPANPIGPMIAFWTAPGTTNACYANCDQSTSNPLLTANDFQCFLNEYAAGTSYANCDGSTNVPALTANDFQCFLNAYAGGCS